MASDAKQVFLHIGLHKTGTTYVQETLSANRAVLLEHGVDFPGGPRQPSQALGVWDLQGRRARGVTDTRVAGQWDALVAHILESALPASLISDEHLALSTLKQARAAVDAFDGCEVQVLVTVRDLARVVVSAWQQQVKSDRTWTWREFSEVIRDPASLAKNPARSFWLSQDVVRICETWEAAVGAGGIHVVTVPRPGSRPELLMERIASVVGFDPAVLTEQPVWANDSVGVAGIEVVRRLNERLGGSLNQREYHRIVRQGVARSLADRNADTRSALPSEESAWVSERAEEFIAALTDHGYRIVGDLDELRPAAQPTGRRPDDVTDAELVDASIDALAATAERYARSWWANKREAMAGVEEQGDAASRARGLVFRTQRRVAELADRSPVAARAVGMVLKARDRARVRARRSRPRSTARRRDDTP